jgi:hypothetical protein
MCGRRPPGRTWVRRLVQPARLVARPHVEAAAAADEAVAELAAVKVLQVAALGHALRDWSVGRLVGLGRLVSKGQLVTHMLDLLPLCTSPHTLHGLRRAPRPPAEPRPPTCSNGGQTVLSPSSPAALNADPSQWFHTNGQEGWLAGTSEGKGRVMSRVSQ